MKKPLFLVFLILLLGCSPTTKKTGHVEIHFSGEAIGIDHIPTLAEIDLRLTIAMIQSGFQVTKKSNTMKFSQLSPVELSMQEASRIKTTQREKWYFVSLPLTRTIVLPTAISRTIVIEKFLIKDNLKSSPIMMALSLGLQENLKNIPSYQGTGYLQQLNYVRIGNDIKIRLKVVLIDHEKH